MTKLQSWESSSVVHICFRWIFNSHTRRRTTNDTSNALSASEGSVAIARHAVSRICCPFISQQFVIQKLCGARENPWHGWCKWIWIKGDHEYFLGLNPKSFISSSCCKSTPITMSSMRWFSCAYFPSRCNAHSHLIIINNPTSSFHKSTTQAFFFANVFIFSFLGSQQCSKEYPFEMLGDRKLNRKIKKRTLLLSLKHGNREWVMLRVHTFRNTESPGEWFMFCAKSCWYATQFWTV